MTLTCLFTEINVAITADIHLARTISLLPFLSSLDSMIIITVSFEMTFLSKPHSTLIFNWQNPQLYAWRNPSIPISLWAAKLLNVDWYHVRFILKNLKRALNSAPKFNYISLGLTFPLSEMAFMPSSLFSTFSFKSVSLSAPPLLLKMVFGPAASTSPGKLLEMQNLSLPLGLLNQSAI